MASIVTLKSGQNIICEVREIFQGEDEDKKGVGLQLSDPFALELYENPEAEDPAERSKVRFARWNPFTLDRTFRVSYDAVIAVSTPDPNLDTAFADKVEYFNSVDVVDELTEEDGSDDTAIETEE